MGTNELPSFVAIKEAFSKFLSPGQRAEIRRARSPDDLVLIHVLPSAEVSRFNIMPPTAACCIPAALGKPPGYHRQYWRVFGEIQNRRDATVSDGQDRGFYSLPPTSQAALPACQTDSRLERVWPYPILLGQESQTKHS